MFPVNSVLVNRPRFLPGLGAEAGTCDKYTGAEKEQCLITFASAAATAKPGETYTGMSAEDRAKLMQKTIMKSAITNAAFNVGFQLMLSVVPVVGQALAAVAAAINFFGGQRYEKKTKEMVAEKTRELEAHIAAKQAELNDAIDSAYKSSWSQALTLAKSPYPIVFDNKTELQVFMRPKAAPVQGLGSLIDKLTGRDTFTKARSQMEQLVSEQRRNIDLQLDPTITRARSSDFRNVLAKSIAIELRKLPEYNAMAKYFDRSGPQSYTENIKDPTSPVYTPAAVPAVSVDTSLWKKLTIGGAAVAGGLLLMRM